MPWFSLSFKQQQKKNKWEFNKGDCEGVYTRVVLKAAWGKCNTMTEKRRLHGRLYP